MLRVGFPAMLAVAVLLLGACADQRPNRLLVFGIDGATWDVIDPMIAAGELPNLAALRSRGAHGDLITVGPQISPVIWTTFATGRFGREHGLMGFVYPYTPGPKQPVEATQRQVPAIWELASSAGRQVGVVGYFTTYPALPINGVMITDRPFSKSGGRYPADVLAPIQEERIDRYADPAHKQRLWSRFFPWDYDPDRPPADESLAEAHRMVSDRIDLSIVEAAFLRDVSNFLLESADEPYDLFIAYYRLVDFASHGLWWYFRPQDYEARPDERSREALGSVIPETYRYMDAALGDLLDRVDDDTNIVVISDHGFGSATGQFAIRGRNKDLLTGNHRPDGIFLAAGPDFQPGEVQGLTVMDVFPIMMAVQGLPVSDELPGRVDTRVFRPGFFDDFPLETVSSYGVEALGGEGAGRATREEQIEEIQSLQGLGYVGDGFEYGERQVEDYDFYAAESSVLRYHLVGEIVFSLLQGNAELARQQYEEVWNRRPDVAADRLLRRVEIAQQILDRRLPSGAYFEAAFEPFFEWAREFESKRTAEES